MKPLRSATLLVLLVAITLLSFQRNHSRMAFPKPSLKNMVLIKQGTFMMGLDSGDVNRAAQRFNEPAAFFSPESPAFRVTVVAFYMDKYDVTNADFKKFVEANPRWAKDSLPDSLQDGNYLKDWDGNKYPEGRGDFPVTYVNFRAANAYAHWVHKRLPTESEWEFTAKGNHHNSITFPWGDADAAPDKANYANTSAGHAVRVGSFPPNSLGIYDMAGNVYQFCMNRWHPDEYAKMAAFEKTRPFVPFTRPQSNIIVIRGGSWNDQPEKLRTTYREGCPTNKCSAFVGFRCAASDSRR